MDREKLDVFLHHFNTEGAPGLLIVEGDDSLENFCSTSIPEYGFAKSHFDAIKALESHKSICLALNQDSSGELYDLVRQYAHRAGIIQVRDVGDHSLRLAHIDVSKARLLVVIRHSEEASTLARFPKLHEVVGMTERLHMTP